MDARAVAPDVEDAVGLARGFVAGPGGPRVDADGGEGFLLINVLGRQVGDARARVDGRGGNGLNGVGQALLVWRREHEGGSDARVAQASPGRVPVKLEQGRVDEDARERVGGRGPGEFANSRGVDVGQAQCRERRTNHEAWVGRADGGSREVVVAVVVVVNDRPTSLIFCTGIYWSGAALPILAIRHSLSPGHRGSGKPDTSQKSLSAIRCIKTRRCHSVTMRGVLPESTERQKVH